MTWKKGEPVPLDVAVMSSVIETSEKGESVPLDVAVMSSVIAVSIKSELRPKRCIMVSNHTDHWSPERE